LRWARTGQVHRKSTIRLSRCGVTATDIILPSFLFIVGVAIVLSFGYRMRRGEDRPTLARHILQRSFLIFVLGLAVNGFPEYHWHTLRIPRILQRIAACYLVGALLYLLISTDHKDERSKLGTKSLSLAIVSVVLLTAYYLLLKFFPVPGFGPAGSTVSAACLPTPTGRFLELDICRLMTRPQAWESATIRRELFPRSRQSQLCSLECSRTSGYERIIRSDTNSRS
jgi:hypothetical protein